MFDARRDPGVQVLLLCCVARGAGHVGRCLGPGARDLHSKGLLAPWEGFIHPRLRAYLLYLFHSKGETNDNLRQSSSPSGSAGTGRSPFPTPSQSCRRLQSRPAGHRRLPRRQRRCRCAPGWFKVSRGERRTKQPQLPHQYWQRQVYMGDL